MSHIKEVWKFIHCRLMFLGLAATAILLHCPFITEAASYNWSVSSGDWSTASNWGGTEPTGSDDANVVNDGTAIITQSGEVCRKLYLGDSHKSGSVEMTSGSLTVSSSAYIGYYGIGTFTQSGGTNTISSNLYIGYSSASNGAYILNGTGLLYAPIEYIGYNGTGTFTHSGGTNTVTCTKISTNGIYTLSGGTLTINGGLDNQGLWDLSDSTATINMSSAIVDLSRNTLTPAGNASINIDANSLLIIPAGHDLTDYFSSINNEGLVHQAGSTLDIAPTKSIYGLGTINDHVNCQGVLSATSGYNINLNDGVTISGIGSVNLNNGSIYINDSLSEMSGGSLNATNQFIGSAGTGTLTQTGGTNTAKYMKISTTGTYILSGGSLNINGNIELQGVLDLSVLVQSEMEGRSLD